MTMITPEFRARRAEYARLWRLKNPHPSRAAVKRWQAKNPDYVKRDRKDRHLRELYGLTLAQYEAMLLEQGGKCPICEDQLVSGKLGTHVDHCHATGKIRGLLCNNCNNMIGRARDNPKTLKRAIAYLSGEPYDDDDD